MSVEPSEADQLDRKLTCDVTARRQWSEWLQRGFGMRIHGSRSLIEASRSVEEAEDCLVLEHLWYRMRRDPC